MFSLDIKGSHERTRFWRRFERVAGNHVNVLRHVLGLTQSSKHTADQLRGSSRAMREAVNRSVTTVHCQLGACASIDELATVFPYADRLDVHGQPLDEGDTGSNASDWLHKIMDSSPLLLQKIQSLSLCLHGRHENDAAARGLADLLSRCVHRIAVVGRIIVSSPIPAHRTVAQRAYRGPRRGSTGGIACRRTTVGEGLLGGQLGSSRLCSLRGGVRHKSTDCL
jgi:hypothetical protein